MEEVRGRRVAFGYGNLLCNYNCKPSLCKSSPPLSAIDRFLWGQTQSLSSHSQAAHQRPYSIQNNVKINKGTMLGSTADALLRGFSFPSDAIGGYLPRQTNLEESFLDGLLVDGEILALTEDKNPNTEMKASMKGDFPKGVVRRNKKVASAALIKGQWTDDEDRKLKRLVKQYGVRKWAQIAESLVGRAGKQCRERWHNHLRPDIKVSLCFHVYTLLYISSLNDEIKQRLFITLPGFVVSISILQNTDYPESTNLDVFHEY
ncbi:transcription factor MYB119-like [Gossypium arboreum]|uniref:transcription factor MYB119-like n=1 Tax=Gossypium arboreum TaxID=29729 RepID=UPI0022F150A7|nr:transcription factor MYB119-like [Gossypium arboreum]